MARDHSHRFMENSIKDYSQWFPGRDNDVSDALSCDDDRDDEELINVLKTFVPSQLPIHFRIVPLPNEIVSWLTSLLQRLLVKNQLQEKHTRTKLGCGVDGANIANQSESHMIDTSTTLRSHNESNSSEPFPWLCVEDVFQDKRMIPWLNA